MYNEAVPLNQASYVQSCALLLKLTALLFKILMDLNEIPTSVLTVFVLIATIKKKNYRLGHIPVATPYKKILDPPLYGFLTKPIILSFDIVLQGTAKKCTKMKNARAEALFLFIKPIVLYRSRLLKFPNC